MKHIIQPVNFLEYMYCINNHKKSWPSIKTQNAPPPNNALDSRPKKVQNNEADR